MRVDSQLSLDPQGLLFLGHGHGQSTRDFQRSIRLEGVEGGCCHCWVKRGGRYKRSRFKHKALRGQELGLLTSTIQDKYINSLSH